ncbi:histidine phosphatase family protein [Rhizobium halophilum]|uniref:histidine phosphatase family protein n=1 Tax=Rhizobium halophilum TaxID=2846852 RepID=UPI001EFE3C8B|nr:histidine phosphatase family protein [Rhizobium halophilum]MCF6369340.1 phosphoglycerate mutase family protein [Rhizobium halophilum]
MFGVYITHPQVDINPNIPVPEWGLSTIGRARVFKSVQLPWAATLQRVIASQERKAIETAELLVSLSEIPVEIQPDMYENDRSATGFLPPQEFEAAADQFFGHPHDSYRGWERAVDAQVRIVAAVTRILDEHDPAIPIAFVGHGGVGTLLKCHLAGHPIARDRDQPPGGGNLYAFSLADRSLSCDWTPMEEWKGFGHGPA